MTIKKLIEGNKKFKKETFPYLQKQLTQLAQQGQKPEILFITCSDSRISPDLVLNTKPGDMFVLRNVGNFVPPFKASGTFHDSASVIEYAVAVLEVKHIIVCGHTHCGACESLYKEIPNNDSFINIKAWLGLGEKTKEMTLKNKNFTTEEEMYIQTQKNSIRNQLSNLLTYPDIKKLYKEKTIQIHGWHYDIETSNINFYDEKTDTFKPINEFNYGK